MSNHAIVTAEEHRDLRVKVSHSAALGDAVMSCFTIPDEFRRLQNEYVILFQRDPESRSFAAVALLGFEPGENLYLDGSEWLASYKPLALSIQPFLLGRPRDEAGDAQVHIDLDHPRVSTGGEGVRAFDDAGQPSPYLEQIVAMLEALDRGYRSSPDFFSALERHDLLEPFALDVELMNGARHRMVGYHLINEEKLASLEGSALTELNAAGHLLPIYMAVASLANLSRLIESKRRRSADG
ncbi:MAG: SapC family protein [Pseudomonadota bacterium]